MRLPLRQLVLLLTSVAACLALSMARNAEAPIVEGAGGFISEPIVPGLSQPIDFASAPDGRIFIAQKEGDVRIFENGQLLPDPFIHLTVNTKDERGLVAITLDPAFATNGYVYLYYVTEQNPSDYAGPKTSQLLRVTANGDVAQSGSEYILLGSVVGDASHPSCDDFPIGSDCIPATNSSHTGGGLRFAADGKLFLSIGESGVREMAQNMDSLSGKVVRLNPDGTAPANNPFYTGDPNALRSKIWALGFRNPFRLNLRPGTSVPFIGDVGSIYREEINVGQSGANFGWPCYEATINLNFGGVCQPLYDSGSQTPPIFDYAHGSGAALIAGVFYNGVNYPTQFQGAFFFGDYIKNIVHTISIDAGNHFVSGSEQTVLDNAAGPVSFAIGPEGNVYYIALNGTIYRIRYVTDNRPPVAIADATPTIGPLPLDVQFNSDGSYDPDLEPISYLWDFGDGDTSTAVNPNHVFADDGDFLVTLTVTDGQSATGMDSVLIQAGNHHPVATVTSPPNELTYVPGQTIGFSGSATDLEDGPLTGSSLSWEIILHHCNTQLASCDAQPYGQASGDSGTFVASTQPAIAPDFYFHEIKLTATDSANRTGSASVFVSPDSDGDGLSDHMEYFTFGLDPFDTDSDNDGTADGAEDFDGDGCGNAVELRTDVGSEAFGGLRDPVNPWDYFNPTQDGLNRTDDISAVVRTYGHDQDIFLDYNVRYDRTPLMGGHSWQFGPPDGLIRTLEITAAVNSYGHDCST